MIKRLIVVVLAIVLAGILFAGCSAGGNGEVESAASPAPAPESGQPQTEGSGDGGIVLTDMAGREVRLAAPATRVIALMPADVEILYAVGAGDTLVGRGEYCNYPPEALDIPSVQSGNDANFEQIIALEPELLLISKVAHDENLIGQFENADRRKSVGQVGQLFAAY